MENSSSSCSYVSIKYRSKHIPVDTDSSHGQDAGRPNKQRDHAIEIAEGSTETPLLLDRDADGEGQDQNRHKQINHCQVRKERVGHSDVSADSLSEQHYED